MLWIYAVTALIMLVGVLLLLSQSLGPRDNPPRTEAGSAVRNIVNALKNFYGDYGHFPEVAKPKGKGGQQLCFGDPACKISSGPNRLLFDVLRAIPRGPNAGHALNPRKVNYFAMRSATDRKHPRSGFADGPEFSDAVQGCLFDPWGHEYCIVMAMDDSGMLDLSSVFDDLAEEQNKVRSSVAAFSLGKDGAVGGKGYPGYLRAPGSTQAPDDIVSWQ
jgi:hypothetical protein